jgi:hypothetical protein
MDRKREHERRGPGRPRKLGEHKALSCRIPLPLYAALRHLALAQGKTFNDLVVATLTDLWEKQPPRFVRPIGELTKVRFK